VIGPGVIVALGGLLLIWVAIRMWQGRLPRNSIAGVRTPTTMRSSEAFDIANKAAEPRARHGAALTLRRVGRRIT
jgi:threonine/homoserine/homoserine lactone efflux protein